MPEKYPYCFLGGPETSGLLLVIGSRSWHRTAIKAIACVRTTNMPSLIAVVVASRFFCSERIEIIQVKTMILACFCELQELW